MSKSNTPRKPHGIAWIKFRISRTEARALDAIARTEHLSRSQLIARIVDEWMAQRDERKSLAAERQLGGSLPGGIERRAI